jgi:hypothetical protein
MKTSNCRGNALLVALIMVVVISGFVGVAVTTTDHSARSADRSRDYAGAQAAAEGAVEYAYGVWKSQIASANGAISGSTLAAPTFPHYSMVGSLQIVPANEYGVSTAATGLPPAVARDVTDYPGWRGRGYNYIARAQMSPGQNYRTGVRRQFEYTEVPLFQAMYFFEGNFEIYRPATMIIGGLVHSNSDMYVQGWNNSGSGSLTFQGKVSRAGNYTEGPPPFGTTWASNSNPQAPIYPNGGRASQLSQVARMEPLGQAPAQVLNTSDSNTNNDSFREIIEPPNTAQTDPPEIATRRLYNKAGMRVNINGSTITVTGANGLTLSAAKQTEIANAISASTTIYDQREGANVDVRTLDIAALRTALSTGVTGFNDVLYIHDTTPRVSGNMEPKTIRLKNGGILPDEGLTVVSENPIYIQGDYNTGSTPATVSNVPSNNNGNPGNADSPTVTGYTRKPAAVIGDAVMLLSNNWNDSNSSLTLSSRPATHTTYNTAIISGFMPSGYQPPSGSQYGYSGGANNFPRFLEQWGGISCTYYGSMVQLFRSERFTGRWNTGNIYGAPSRCWNYDTLYNDNPPPGAVSGTTWSRGTWAKWTDQP